MSIFKLSEEELEKYLKENIDTKKTNKLLEELIECGLESREENGIERHNRNDE